MARRSGRKKPAGLEAVAASLEAAVEAPEAATKPPVKSKRDGSGGDKGGDGGDSRGTDGGGGGNNAPEKPQYFQSASGTFWNRPTREGPVPTLLANITPLIDQEIDKDDGIERTRYIDLSDNLGGRNVHFRLPVDMLFNAKRWSVREYGASANISPGEASSDRLRHAIQVLSYADGRKVQRRQVITHTGWRKIEGLWFYLHAGGAIGPDGPTTEIETDLEGKLAYMDLREPLKGKSLQAAVSAALEIIELGPLPVTAAMLAAVARAPLGPADFAIWLCGRSGAFKSAVAGVIQGFWGSKFQRKFLLAKWDDTANWVREVLFYAKDAVCVVDNLRPGSSYGEIQETRKKIGQVLHAVGDGSGRGRLSSDTSMRAVHDPRALLFSTGEEAPSGFSDTARTLILEVAKGDFSSPKLYRLMDHCSEGTLVGCLASFIQWLARDIETIRERHEARKRDLMIAAGPGAHARTPEMLAELGAALELFLDFAVDSLAIHQDLREKLWRDLWPALLSLAKKQEELQHNEAPEERFIEILSGALAARQCHLVSTTTTSDLPPSPGRCGWRRDAADRWIPGGPSIGWVDTAGIYLDPGPAFEQASQRATQRGSALGVTQRTLGKRLAETGLLLMTDGDGRNQYSKKIAGVKRRAWVLDRAQLIGEEIEGEAEEEVAAATPAPAHNQALELLEVAVTAMRERSAAAATGDELAGWLSGKLSGRPMSAKAVAAAMGSLGLTAKQTWRNGRNVRSYYRADLEFTLGKLHEELPLDDEAPAAGDLPLDDDPAGWNGEYEPGDPGHD